ncbi:hypothetical protein D3C72_2361570 [compost metagenome]
MVQHRHAAGRRDVLELRIAGVEIKRDEPFLEGNAAAGQRHPRTERPGGIVLVADIENERVHRRAPEWHLVF